MCGFIDRDHDQMKNGFESAFCEKKNKGKIIMHLFESRSILTVKTCTKEKKRIQKKQDNN